MARRTIYVGGMAELEQVEEQYRGRLVPGDYYVFGCYCDATPEAGLLWEDLRLCYKKAKLTAKQKYAHSQAIKLVPFSEIAEQMNCTPQAVDHFVQAAEKKLDALRARKQLSLGCFTQIVEACGGWAQVRHHVADIARKHG